MNRFAVVIVLAGSLSACSLAPSPAAGPRPPNPSNSSSNATGAGAELPPESSRNANPAPGSTATRALLTQSQAEREAGDLGGAAVTVERALTISPDEALLWIELAEIRMAQGDRATAEEMAQKALTLTAQNTTIAARARRLIRN